MTIDEYKSALMNAYEAGDQDAVVALGRKIEELENSPEQLADDYRTMPWSEVAGKAVSNIPSSAAQMGSDIYQAVTNPLDTAATIAEVGVGALTNLYPDWYIEALDNYILPEDTLQTAQAKSGMVWDAMKNRYGGEENIKRTIANDPTGFAGDVAGIISGGATLAGKAGVMSANLANKAQKVASFIDPVSLAAKGTGTVFKGASKIPSAVAGLTTGMGQDVVSELYKAGKKGGRAKQTALSHMRHGDEVGEEILVMARDAMEKLRADRRDAYKTGMVDIKNDPAILNFDAIDEAFARTINENTFKGVPKSKDRAAALQDVASELEAWKGLGPEYMTPEGLDTLKQRIGEMVNWTDKSEATNQAYLDVYDAIRSEINKQAPVYGEIMGDYHEASKTIKEMEKALSLKDTAAADTTFRKLTSTLRNNVNTNFGQRGKLVGQLEEKTGAPLKAAIAGQSANTWTPRGLQGIIGAGNVLDVAADVMTGGGVSGARMMTLPAQSPRLVGEAAVGAGSMARALSNTTRGLPPTARYTMQYMAPHATQAMKSIPVRAGLVQGGRLQDEDLDPMTKALIGK